MEILPKTQGMRPRLACEIRREGVVAARSVDGAPGVMVAVSKATLPPGTFQPGLHLAITDRGAVVNAVRQALEKVFERNRTVTLVVPDSSVRVLLLDFDALPNRLDEALPVVRFRLKKLLPFDSDDAAVSYQIMSSSRGLVRVVAIAMPRDVLAEYESVVREAGFEPGAVLPSTLAVLAGLEESPDASLLVNAGPESVTTAIVQSGILLLHRSVDMHLDLQVDTSTEMPALPLIDRENSAEEWAMQEGAEEHTARSITVTALLERPEAYDELGPARLPPAEMSQAISVAAAYFEDTLNATPPVILSAGVLSAAQLERVLVDTDLATLRTREMVDTTMIPAGTSSAVPRGWLAGIRGALRS